MNDYESFLRDCAFNARNFEREPLTGAELSMLLGVWPDLLDEALGGGGMPMVLVRMNLESGDRMGMGCLVTVCLREKAMAYIAADLRRARLDHEEETRIDMRFHA